MVANVGVTRKRAQRNPKIVVDFRPEDIKAPFFLRCGALLIDYVLIVSIPVIGLLLARLMGRDGPGLLNDSFSDTGWLIAFLLGLTNIVILPLFTGQTLGKMCTGLRIVSNDGTPASARRILLRQTLGYILTISSAGIGFLMSLLSSKSRALHDYIAGTVVIFADRRSRD